MKNLLWVLVACATIAGCGEDVCSVEGAEVIEVNLIVDAPCRPGTKNFAVYITSGCVPQEEGRTDKLTTSTGSTRWKLYEGVTYTAEFRSEPLRDTEQKVYHTLTFTPTKEDDRHSFPCD